MLNGPFIKKIDEIQEVWTQKSEIVKKEKEASTPLLTDFSLIERLHTWFWQTREERPCAPRGESVYQRKKFLFIILFLYSPATLAGGKMTKGLRDKLADVLDMQSRSAISDNCADVVFLYNHYKDFRNDVNTIYNQIIRRLQSYGLQIDPAA